MKKPIDPVEAFRRNFNSTTANVMALRAITVLQLAGEKPTIERVLEIAAPSVGGSASELGVMIDEAASSIFDAVEALGQAHSKKP